MATDTELLTLEGYAALDEPDDGYVSELVRGMVVREPLPGPAHARIQVELVYLLTVWTKETGTGVVYAESGFILQEDPATVRGPDVAVVTRPHDWDGKPGGWIRGAPELVVEVLSPSDASTATQAKMLEYLAAGALLVWIVDPRARTVTAYRPDNTATLVRADQTLTGEDVLPGFSLELAELFGQLDR